ncbi:glucosidase 2 subunit beta [Nilaparvata lugens]|uniref:glucosidase 2 subunit beta n=1 Tax=Nilaparvata lugens TaxID=108931 RepID=UPI00193EA07B|nr:glucosidase 2 subunit beta [Nilaparvata lugens]
MFHGGLISGNKITKVNLYSTTYFLFYNRLKFLCSTMVRIYGSFLFVLVSFVRSNEIFRPRGVAITKAVLYDASKDFTCFNGALTIPFKYVNDDFCDCLDGSDEPGTAACPNGSFHCVNAGHKSMIVPSSRVNDGICDCCDASDEYAHPDLCGNICDKLGEEARVAAQRRAEIIKAGCELREQLSWKGKKLKEEKKEKIAVLEKDKAEAESLKEEREANKKKAETIEAAALEIYRNAEEAKRKEKDEQNRKQMEQEAFEVFNQLDSDRDEKLQVDELRVRQTFDQNKDGQVSDDELKFFMGGLEEITWADFLESGWQRMKPFFMLEKGIFQPPSTEQKTESQEAHTEGHEGGEDDLGGMTHEEYDDGTADDEDEFESVDEPAENGEHADEEGDDGAAKKAEEESAPKYDEMTQKVIDIANAARSEFESADREVKDLERSLRQLQEGLNKDYGHEEEFAPLDGECFEFTDREYVYKLCPFDRVSQRPRSGGSETTLGLWQKWVGRENPYSAMLYDQGQTCWNGPQRSTHVQVSCGVENVVLSVSEPNRCEYLFHLATPSACWPELPQQHPHDEL